MPCTGTRYVNPIIIYLLAACLFETLWLCLMWSGDPFVWINCGLEVCSFCHVCYTQRWDLHNLCV